MAGGNGVVCGSAVAGITEAQRNDEEGVEQRQTDAEGRALAEGVRQTDVVNEGHNDYED